MEEHDRMDALDSVGDSQLSYSADTESESNSSSTCCSSSSSTKAVSLLDRLCAPTPSTLARKRKSREETGVRTGEKFYKNNRGSFRELQSRIVGGKKYMLKPTCRCK